MGLLDSSYGDQINPSYLTNQAYTVSADFRTKPGFVTVCQIMYIFFIQSNVHTLNLQFETQFRQILIFCRTINPVFIAYSRKL